MLQDPEKEYISKRSTHLQGCKLIKKKRRTLLLKTASFGGWGGPPISHLEGGVGGMRGRTFVERDAALCDMEYSQF